MIRSDYRYYFSQDHLVIEDLNKGGRSVTNDIENILQDIHTNEGHRLDGVKCVYLDSEGIWDAIDIKTNGKEYDVMFRFLSAKTLEQAIERNNYNLTHITKGIPTKYNLDVELNMLISNIKQGNWNRSEVLQALQRIKEKGNTLDDMINILKN